MLRALASAILLLVAPARAGGFLGVGGGIIHSDGPAAHLSVPLYRAVELHYSFWRDGEGDHAIGVGYRFANGGPISVVLGVSYIGTVTENLLRHGDAYIEVRVDLTRHFGCQVSHYSTIGDDNGENFLLCGVYWGGDGRAPG